MVKLGAAWLIFAMSTLETLRQTQAMLEQKRVSLKYGLPQYLGFGDTAKGTASIPNKSASIVPPAQVSSPAASCVKIQTFDSSILELDSGYQDLLFPANGLGAIGG